MFLQRIFQRVVTVRSDSCLNGKKSHSVLRFFIKFYLPVVQRSVVWRLIYDRVIEVALQNLLLSSDVEQGELQRFHFRLPFSPVLSECFRNSCLVPEARQFRLVSIAWLTSTVAHTQARFLCLPGPHCPWSNLYCQLELILRTLLWQRWGPCGAREVIWSYHRFSKNQLKCFRHHFHSASVCVFKFCRIT